jgi:site-specific DNA recombinase
VNVLSGAPYGYRYVTRTEGGGTARYEILEDQAQVVRQMFDWMGRERLSLGEVQRRLTAATIPTPRGNAEWDRSTIWGILSNPAYRGQAAFGKTHTGTLRPRLRAQRNRSLQPRRAYSTYDQPAANWLPIPVPALVDEALFNAVQEQFEENRRCARQRQRGAKYLLQGLLVCAGCGYAYYGKSISSRARQGHNRTYAYYRCVGSEAYRFGGQRVCHNTQVRTDRLEPAVWQAVCQLLADPHRVAAEYQRRLDALQVVPGEARVAQVEPHIVKVRQGMARLIDGYAEGYLDKTEVEPRIRRFKERLQALEEQASQRRAQAQTQADLQLVIGRLEEFSAKVQGGLEQLDWHGRRELIRTLVKRVEIDRERIKVVFRVEGSSFPSTPAGEGPIMQDCGRRPQPLTGESLPASSGPADGTGRTPHDPLGG